VATDLITTEPTTTSIDPALVDPDTVVSRTGQPTWEVARLFPRQGYWTEAAYLDLGTKQLVEFVRGRLEFLPVPTLLHQRLLKRVFLLLNEVVERLNLGEVFPAPLRVRTIDDVIREPDIVFLESDDDADPRAPTVVGMQLAVEIVSPGKRNRDRDLEEKREEYAEARVPEYWIVDEEERRVTVLVLDGDRYRVHGEFASGTTATSVLLPEFAIDVTDLFDAARGTAR
jgi:Uma2 family endonuclease